MTLLATEKKPPLLDRPGEWALLLDYDGTLTPIVDNPEKATLDAASKALLIQIGACLQGAIAVLSGRSLAQLRQLLTPFAPTLFGQHGAEWIDARGEIQTFPFDSQALAQVRQRLLALCRRYPGLALEDKGAGLALHYRRLSTAERDKSLASIRRYLEAEARRLGTHVLQEGKCVFDLHPAGSDKGRCVEQIMGNWPFRGRKPLFIGDDLTDEKGFQAVAGAGGMSIKIGPGQSMADYRLANPEALLGWLAACLQHWRRAEQS